MEVFVAIIPVSFGGLYIVYMKPSHVGVDMDIVPDSYAGGFGKKVISIIWKTLMDQVMCLL
jgi:hypothetical protein